MPKAPGSSDAGKSHRSQLYHHASDAPQTFVEPRIWRDCDNRNQRGSTAASNGSNCAATLS